MLSMEPQRARSHDPEIMTCAEIKSQTLDPLSHLGVPEHNFKNNCQLNSTSKFIPVRLLFSLTQKVRVALTSTHFCLFGILEELGGGMEKTTITYDVLFINYIFFERKYICSYPRNSFEYNY